MGKEFEPIQQVITRREKANRILGLRKSRRETLWERVEKNADINETQLQENELLEIGKVIKKDRVSEKRLTIMLTSLDQEIAVYRRAKKFLVDVAQKQTALTDISKLVAEGNLPKAAISSLQRQVEAFKSLPERDPILLTGLERIRQEEEARKKVQTVEITPTPAVKAARPEREPELEKSKIYQLSNGEVVGGKVAELLRALEGSSQENGYSRDQLIKDIWPDIKNETKAISRLHALFTITRKIICGSGLEIINLTPHSARHKGEIASYYLKKPDQQKLSVEAAEFGTLSRADIAMIATAIDNHRPQLTLLLRQTDVKLIEADITHDLIALAGDKIVTEFGEMTLDKKSQFIKEYGSNALERARNLIESSNFNEIKVKINDQNIDVYCLLENLSDINKVQLKSIAGQQQGLNFLKELIANPGNFRLGVTVIKPQPETITPTLSADVTLFDNKSIAPIPDSRISETIPKTYAVEKRDPEIRAKINQYLNDILSRQEFKSPVSADALTRVYKSIKWLTIEKALKDKVIIVEYEKRHNRARFDVIATASLLYLYSHGKNLPVKLRRQVQTIVAEEFEKREKEK